MTDIWNNPLMWKKDTQPPKESGADSGDFNLDALDLLIQEAEGDGIEFPAGTDLDTGFHIPDIETKNFQNIFIGKPKESADALPFRINDVLKDVPTGHSAFGTGVFNTSAAGSFDFYNALGTVTESGGISDRLGVSDGTAIETGMKIGMNVRGAVDNRDTLKTALSLLSLTGGKPIDKKNLDYMREYASTHNLDALREHGEEIGMKLPENVSTTDLYYLTLATKADQNNFDVVLSNMNKMV